MTPSALYQEKCATGAIQYDALQWKVMQHFDALQSALIDEVAKRNGLFSVLRKHHTIQGLYLWGGVGIGKTFLLDCFYNTLPFANKHRIHFHAYMRQIHAGLKRHQGEANPLEFIAREMAKQYCVLCFDEFVVNDIADAMILGRLFKYLFAFGVTLITTSNLAPDDLYRDGLQRREFLPAIALLKANTTVYHLPTAEDYRLLHLQAAGVFYTPFDAASDAKMLAAFRLFADGHEVMREPILICGRKIPIIQATKDTVWFEYQHIAKPPRSPADYLALVDQYRTILISHVPVIPPGAKDLLTLFMRMIDVFYDARIRLIWSAAQPIEALIAHGQLGFELARTRSRLLEMQSQFYLKPNPV